MRNLQLDRILITYFKLENLISSIYSIKFDIHVIHLKTLSEIRINLF